MYNSSDFANRLKELRIKYGHTQAEMAQFCGVSTRMWVKYEQGVMPGGEVLLKIAYHGFDMEYLFTGIRLTEEESLECVLLNDELKLIKNYRDATDKSREVILGVSELVEKKYVFDDENEPKTPKRKYLSF